MPSSVQTLARYRPKLGSRDQRCDVAGIDRSRPSDRATPGSASAPARREGRPGRRSRTRSSRERACDVGGAGVPARLRHEGGVRVRHHVAPRGLILDERSTVRERAPQLDVAELGFHVRRCSAPGIVGSPGEPGVRFEPHHRVHSLRSGRREQGVRSAGLEDARRGSGRSDPTASSTISRSETLVSRLGSATFRLDSPMPRRSWRISRENEATSSNQSLASGSFQLDIDVAGPVRLPDHVDRAVSDDLVGDVHPVRRDRIVGIEDTHAPS